LEEIEDEWEEMNPFSEPWEDSDLVLLVENKRFHVHRQMLSLHSPVFKAMLKTQFKEATADEIPLPGKKANEILSFLKQLYMKERDGITLDKIDHLLKLSDEYQAMSVFDLCVRFLKNEPKTKENVVRILYLANVTAMAREDERLDIARRHCYSLVEDMELADVVGKEDYRNLDRDGVEGVFKERITRLETFLKRIYPQVIGLTEFCILLCLESSRVTRCPEHFPSNNKATEGLIKRIKSCPVCRTMIQQLVSCSMPTSLFGREPNEHRYGGNCHFDTKIISIIRDFKNILKFEVV